MADRNDGSIAPRRRLSGPILPPPPPEMAEDARKAEADKAAAQRAEAEKRASETQKSEQRSEQKAAQAQGSAQEAAQPSGKPSRPAKSPRGAKGAGKPGRAKPRSAPRRTRRAQLRLVQVDAWSVMKTSFLLSIALGIVLVVAVAIIWSVLGAAGVWDSINSIVQQAIGGEGEPFDIQEYAGTSRVLGFTMIVAVIDVILITAIATLGAFLYNLSAALLGGVEVTLAEDS
ncbi:MAG TPA: DUF3566 domain-containing protein [Propionicimonas sp.]|nr:DUF3566 domain-containing protein [Propionicimonas sp.]